MHGLGDFHAPLDSVAVISLFESNSRALSYAASRLLLEVLFCWCPGISGSLPTPFVVLLFCPGFSETAFCSFKVPAPASLCPLPPLAVDFLSWLLCECFRFFRVPASLTAFCRSWHILVLIFPTTNPLFSFFAHWETPHLKLFLTGILKSLKFS